MAIEDDDTWVANSTLEIVLQRIGDLNILPSIQSLLAHSVCLAIQMLSFGLFFNAMGPNVLPSIHVALLYILYTSGCGCSKHSPGQLPLGATVEYA
jgi:hypothetical protein